MDEIDAAAQDRLGSWKEIAVYLDTSVRTVQRWGQVEGLPIHRHEHSRSGSCFASKAELDRWRAGRQVLLVRGQRSPLIRMWFVTAVSGVAVACAGWIGWRAVRGVPKSCQAWLT